MYIAHDLEGVHFQTAFYCLMHLYQSRTPYRRHLHNRRNNKRSSCTPEGARRITGRLPGVRRRRHDPVASPENIAFMACIKAQICQQQQEDSDSQQDRQDQSLKQWQLQDLCDRSKRSEENCFGYGQMTHVPRNDPGKSCNRL